MRLTGDELEASAPGAGKRADFLLLAYKGDEEHPYVLGYAYHTTNVVPETSSGDTEQAYPETRVLCHLHIPLRGLMEEAATALAQALQLPTPITNESEIEKILDPVVWVDTVLQPHAATMPDENDESDASMRIASRADATMPDTTTAVPTMPDATEDADGPNFDQFSDSTDSSSDSDIDSTSAAQTD